MWFWMVLWYFWVVHHKQLGLFRLYSLDLLSNVVFRSETRHRDVCILEIEDVSMFLEVLEVLEVSTLILPVCCWCDATSAGVHGGRILPPELEGRAPQVPRAHEYPAAQQPDGQQDLDARHLLPQRQEVGGSQHDHAQQTAEDHGGRHAALHHEVALCSLSVSPYSYKNYSQMFLLDYRCDAVNV